MLKFSVGQIWIYEGNKRIELGGGNMIRTKEEWRGKQNQKWGGGREEPLEGRREITHNSHF